MIECTDDHITTPLLNLYLFFLLKNGVLPLVVALQKLKCYLDAVYIFIRDSDFLNGEGTVRDDQGVLFN